MHVCARFRLSLTRQPTSALLARMKFETTPQVSTGDAVLDGVLNPDKPGK